MIGIAGCSQVPQIQSGNDIKDTDGDGVIDSEDYAPRDASVQDAEDVEEVGSTEQNGGDEGQPTETEDQPTETEDQPSEDPNTETVVIDNFESGSLSSNWIDAFDTSNVGSDVGRSNFTVQSSNAPEGQYGLRGNADEFSEGGSSITRDDFTIEEDTTISFHLKLGEVFTGAGRPNSITLGTYGSSDSLEENSNKEENMIVYVSQQSDKAVSPTISDESLSSVRLVELKDVSFEDQQIGEVVIGSETAATNVDFVSDSEVESVDWITVHQGHWRQSADIVVDEIQYS
jgi:hypothetical protein